MSVDLLTGYRPSTMSFRLRLVVWRVHAFTVHHAILLRAILLYVAPDLCQKQCRSQGTTLVLNNVRLPAVGQSFSSCMITNFLAEFLGGTHSELSNSSPPAAAVCQQKVR